MDDKTSNKFEMTIVNVTFLMIWVPRAWVYEKYANKKEGRKTSSFQDTPFTRIV